MPLITITIDGVYMSAQEAVLKAAELLYTSFEHEYKYEGQTYVELQTDDIAVLVEIEN